MMLAACSSSIVDVDITVDGCPIALAERMTIETFDGERLVRELDVPSPTFPTGVRLVGDSPSTNWRVRAILFDANNVAISSIEANGNFTAPSVALHFEDRCLGVICSEGESCIGGACGRPNAPRSEPLAQCPAMLFVSAEGTDDSICGSFDAPCRTVAHLAAPGTTTAAAGAVINVAGGVYEQGFLLQAHYRGPMVVRAWPDTGRPIFRMAGEDAIRVWTSDVTIQDLDVEGATQHGITHNAGGAQSNLRIRRCGFRNNGTDNMDVSAGGIMLQGDLDDFDVEDCTFDGHPRRAVYVGNIVSNGRFRRNRFTNNTDGILVLGQATDIEIVDNILSMAGRGIVFQNTMAAPLSVRIEHNHFCGHDNLAVRFPGQATSVVSVDHNTFIGNATGLTGGSGATKSFGCRSAHVGFQAA